MWGLVVGRGQGLVTAASQPTWGHTGGAGGKESLLEGEEGLGMREGRRTGEGDLVQSYGVDGSALPDVRVLPVVTCEQLCPCPVGLARRTDPWVLA